MRKTKLQYLWALITLVFFTSPLFAQIDVQTPFFFSLNYRTGENKPHRAIIKNLAYPYQGVDLKMGWQTIGKQLWQQAYRYPSFGIEHSFAKIWYPLSTSF